MPGGIGGCASAATVKQEAFAVLTCSLDACAEHSDRIGAHFQGAAPEEVQMHFYSLGLPKTFLEERYFRGIWPRSANLLLALPAIS